MVLQINICSKIFFTIKITKWTLPYNLTFLHILGKMNKIHICFFSSSSLHFFIYPSIFSKKRQKRKLLFFNAGHNICKIFLNFGSDLKLFILYLLIFHIFIFYFLKKNAKLSSSHFSKKLMAVIFS